MLPQAFFSLDHFLHAPLFENCSFVWEALGRLSSYLQTRKLGVIETEVPFSVHLVNPAQISIGRGTLIEPGAFIQGPCLIGDHCVIRHGAYIRGNLITGDHCVIGHATEIKHSILLHRVCAAHFNYVGDSILGNEVNLGAGAKCANLRLDHRPVSITISGKKIDTGMMKLGAIIGDGTQIGCNSVTNPGTLLGKNSFCYPCLNVQGYFPEKSRIKPAHPNCVEKGS